MIRAHRIIGGVLLGALLLLAACHSDPRLAYVNEETKETLLLSRDSGLKNMAISTFHGVQVGYYTLSKPGGSVGRGQFVWNSDSIRLDPPVTCSFLKGTELEAAEDSAAVALANNVGADGRCAQQGTGIVLKFGDDEVLRDAAGNIWKPAPVRSVVMAEANYPVRR